MLVCVNVPVAFLTLTYKYILHQVISIKNTKIYVVKKIAFKVRLIRLPTMNK